jgi:hypothetical protein
VAGQRAQFLPAFQIPDLQRSVPRSGDGPPPIRGHRHASDISRVAGQRAQFLAAFQIPDLQRGTPKKELAHYYRFAEIWHGNELKAVQDPPPGTPDDQKYKYNGKVIPFDAAKVLPVVDNPKASKYPPTSRAHYLNDNFNYAYTSLLKALHLTFNGQPKRLDSAIALMHSMRELAMEMMTVPFEKGDNAGPSFEYQPVNP